MSSPDPHDIVHYPLSSEKSIRLMESQNKLIFIVKQNATKPQIKHAIQQLFQAKVQKVNTHILHTGKKQAIIQFTKETPAIDIATNLGLM